MEFELYFINPKTITSSWHSTAKQILPEHIMSFSMTKNVFSGKLPSGCVASSTMSLTIDNSGDDYTTELTDHDYWVFVANPAEERNNGAPDFITSFHLDSAQMNQNKWVSVNGYDAIDLLDQLTISAEDITPVFSYPSEDRHYQSILRLLDFDGLGFKLDLTSEAGYLADPDFFRTPSAAFPTGDITYRQLLEWIGEMENFILEVSGDYTTNYGTIFKWYSPARRSTAGSYPNTLPYGVEYLFYYDNADDPDRPMSYSTQTRDLEATTVTGVNAYRYNSDDVVLVGNDNGYVITVENNPFVPDSESGRRIAFSATQVRWDAFLRHNTSAFKEAFCKGGYWYEANTPTPIPLRERWHTNYMGFLNHNPHTVNNRQVYGDIIPCPISTYTYTCNGMESVNCDVESDTESTLIPSSTPTDSAINELQNNVHIIDAGTDTNGWDYKKYDDGTYEATKKITLSSVACTTAEGSLYRTAEQTFTNRPVLDNGITSINVSFWASSTNRHAWVCTVTRPATGTIGTWAVISATNTAISGTMCAVVRGTW